MTRPYLVAHVEERLIESAILELDPEQIEYSIRDIARVVGGGCDEDCVRYHARKKFPNRNRAWYRFTLEDAMRLVKYVRRQRYKKREAEQNVILTQHLQPFKRK